MQRRSFVGALAAMGAALGIVRAPKEPVEEPTDIITGPTRLIDGRFKMTITSVDANGTVTRRAELHANSVGELYGALYSEPK